ncbi:MAG: hypothetical protein ACD_79C00244G0001, partial [uncultured bacterium]
DVILNSVINESAFIKILGKYITKEDFNIRGIPEKTLTVNYAIENGEIKYSTANYVFNEIQHGDQIKISDNYEMDFVEDPQNAGSYTVMLRKVTRREVYEFDKYSNAIYAETKNYEILKGNENLQAGGVNVEALRVMDLDNLNSLVDAKFDSQTGGDFEWKSGQVENNYIHDPRGYATASENKSYTVEERGGVDVRVFNEGNIVNRIYDLRGNITDSTTLNYKMLIKREQVNANDPASYVLEAVNANYSKFARELITLKNREIDTRGNPHFVLEEHYSLDSQDVNAALTPDLKTAQNVIIKSPTTIGTLEYGSETYNHEFNFQDGVLQKTIYKFVADENGNKLFTEGENVEYKYDIRNRPVQIINAQFAMILKTSGLDTANSINFDRKYETVRVTENKEFDPSGKYPAYVVIRNFQLKDEDVNTADKVIDNEGNIIVTLSQTGNVVSLPAFNEIGGSETRFSDFTYEGIALNTVISNFVIENGSKVFYDGILKNTFVDEGRIYKTDTYELFYDLKEGVNVPSGMNDYDVSIMSLKTRETLKDDAGYYVFDIFDNSVEVENKSFEISEGKETIAGISNLTDLMKLDLTGTSQSFKSKQADFVWVSGSLENNYKYDFKKNPLQTEYLNYTVRQLDNGAFVREFNDGLLVNQEYDLRDRLIKKTELDYTIALNAGTQIQNTDRFDAVNSKTQRRYKEVVVRGYSDFTAEGFAGMETEDHYQIMEDVLASDNPKSYLTIYDEDTKANTKINMAVEGQTAPGTAPVIRLNWGKVKINYSFTPKGDVLRQNEYTYAVNEANEKEYTSGRVIENKYDKKGRNIESVEVLFALNYNTASNLSKTDYLNAYTQDFEYAIVRNVESFDRTNRFARDVRIREFNLPENEETAPAIVMPVEGAFFSYTRDRDNKVNAIQGFTFTGGEDVLNAKFIFDGSPIEVRTEKYSMTDGVKIYVQGTVELNTYDIDRLVTGKTYQMAFDLKKVRNENGELVNIAPANGVYSLSDYTVYVTGLEIKEVAKDSNGEYMFDIYDNELEVEYKSYTTNEPAIETTYSLETYKNENFNTVAGYLENSYNDGKGGSQFTWNSGRVEKNSLFDNFGNALTTETYEYTVRLQAGNLYRHFSDGSLENNV